MQEAWLWLICEHAIRERPDINATHSIGRKIVEANRSWNGFRAEQHLAFLPVQPHPSDIAAADNQSSGLMQRHSADAATLRNDERYLASKVQKMDAAVQHVAEIKAPRGVPKRCFYESIAAGYV